MSSGFTFVDSLVGDHDGPFVTAACVAGAIALVSVVARKKLKSSSNPLIPDRKLTIRNFFEIIAEFVVWIGDSSMGKENRKYLPFLACVFVYIFFLNAIGLIPGFVMPTDQFQFNLGVALVVFVIYNYWGIKEVGAGNYIKHLCGPVLFLAPFIFSVELISHMVRPVSLSLRLFGNMTGDHLTLSIFTDLTKDSVIFFIPVVFYVLGTAVAFIQAFIFTLLSGIYIRLATAHEDH